MSETISPEIRRDYDALLEVLMPFAEQMLQKHGEFFPYAAAVMSNGEVAAHAAYEGEEARSEDVIGSLVHGFLAQARDGTIRATGICYDGRIVQDGSKTDAVIINLEHRQGSASKTYVPYKKGFFGKYKFGNISAGPAEPQIFEKV